MRSLRFFLLACLVLPWSLASAQRSGPGEQVTGRNLNKITFQGSKRVITFEKMRSGRWTDGMATFAETGRGDWHVDLVREDEGRRPETVRIDLSRQQIIFSGGRSAAESYRILSSAGAGFRPWGDRDRSDRDHGQGQGHGHGHGGRPPVRLTERQDGDTVTVPLGGRVEVALSQASGTPHRWILTQSLRDKALHSTGEPRREPGGRPGAPVTTVWTFEAAHPGETRLIFLLQGGPREVARECVFIVRTPRN